MIDPDVLSGDSFSGPSSYSRLSSLSAAPAAEGRNDSSGSGSDPFVPSQRVPGTRQSSYLGEGTVSPLHEAEESDLQLDLNLEDMDGIVDQDIDQCTSTELSIPICPICLVWT